MKISKEHYEEIIISKADDNEVIAIISDDKENIVKNGYKLELVPAIDEKVRDIDKPKETQYEKDKKILCQQLELLAERSKNAMDEELESLSNAMVQIYEVLYKQDIIISTDKIFSRITSHLEENLVYMTPGNVEESFFQALKSMKV